MIRRFKNFTPQIAESVIMFENTSVCGNVKIDERVSLYPGAVIRAEEIPVTIGEGTNIQDNCVIHIRGKAGEACHETHIGKNVSIGHGAIIHGATVGDNSTIGMGAILQDGAVVGKDCLIGAGSVVTGKTNVPDGHLAFGFPAKVARPLTEAEIEDIRTSSEHYRELAEEYMRTEMEDK